MDAECTVQMSVLLDYIERRLNMRTRNWVREHLAGNCRQCWQRVAWLIRIAAPEEADRLAGPLSEHGMRESGLRSSAREATDAPRREPLTRVMAHLIMEGPGQSKPAGTRGAPAPVRRLTCEAPSNIRVDIQLEESGRGGFTLEGQVMIFGGSLADAGGVAVALHRAGETLASVNASGTGEFSLGAIETGVYDLTVVIDDLCVIAPQIEV